MVDQGLGSGKQTARPARVASDTTLLGTSLLSMQDGSTENIVVARQRVNRGIYLVYLTAFLGAAMYSVVLPSLPTYNTHVSTLTEPKTFLGWIVAGYSIGQFAAGVPLGFWFNKRGLYEPLVFSVLLLFAGNVYYSFASNQWDLLMARVTVGLGAGNISVCRAFASHSTTLGARVKVMARLSGAQGVGFIVGPAMGFLLGRVDTKIGAFALNDMTSPGITAAFFCLLNLLAIPLLRIPTGRSQAQLLHSSDDLDPSHSARTYQTVTFGSLNDGDSASSSGFHALSGEARGQHPQRSGGGSRAKLYTSLPASVTDAQLHDVAPTYQSIAAQSVSTDPRLDSYHPSWWPLTLCLFNFIVVTVIFATFETIIAQITKDVYHWDVTANAIFFAVAGVVSVISFLVLQFLNSRVSDLVLAVSSLCVLTLSQGLAITFSGQLQLARFLVAMTLFCLSYPMASSLMYAVFSKLLGPRPQGTYMGWLTASGATARILGPLYASYVYAEAGLGYVFTGTASAGLVAILIQLSYASKVSELHRWSRLSQYQDDEMDIHSVGSG